MNYLRFGVILTLGALLMAVVYNFFTPAEKQITVLTQNDSKTYIGYSDASDHGYAMAVVAFEENKITDVILKEYTELSVEKDFSTYEYVPSVKMHQVLPQRIVKAQGINVEEISGATASYERYKQAVKRAIESAKLEKVSNRKYFDGIFQGRSRADNHGYGIALVEIKDDRITSVKLKEVDERGQLKDFDTYDHKPSKEAHEQLPQWFIKANSSRIDNFTGATHSTEKYKEAVENALAKALIKKSIPDFLDGTYIAVSDADSEGYSSAKVTIENDIIVDVKLKEYNEFSAEKDFDSYAYEPSVNANKELPHYFILAQSHEVDVVAGATHSSRNYIQSVQRALIKASWTKKADRYFDGIFQAASDMDDHGYSIAVVTIKDDKINHVELKEIDAEGREIDMSQYQYEPAVKAFYEMPVRFVNANTYEVNSVTGATMSCKKYCQAVKRALESARKY